MSKKRDYSFGRILLVRFPNSRGGAPAPGTPAKATTPPAAGTRSATPPAAGTAPAAATAVAEGELADQDGWKVRTVVVVSSDAYNRQGNDLIVACITSNPGREEAEDIAFPDTHPDFKRTWLKKSSVIRCGKLYTWDRTDDHRAFGRLPDDVLQEIKKRLAGAFGL